MYIYKLSALTKETTSYFKKNHNLMAVLNASFAVAYYVLNLVFLYTDSCEKKHKLEMNLNQFSSFNFLKLLIKKTQLHRNFL